MNERIKELAEQAGFETDRGPLIGPSPYIKVGGLCVGVPLEKFAELLVKECIEQCSKALVEHTGQPSVTHNYAVGLCQDNIKEHFGVK